MKKALIALISLISAFNLFSAQFIDGKEFLTLKEPVIFKEFQVLEFFSFYCFPCFQFEEVLHISDSLKKKLPKSIKMVKYHAGSFGSCDEELTRAWAVATLLGVENKIISPMFMAVQKTHSIQNVEDIRNVFINSGVEGKVYDAAWNSYSVNLLVEKQKRAASLLHLRETPTVYVNGKYQVNPLGLNINDTTTFLQQYVNIVKFLTEKK